MLRVTDRQLIAQTLEECYFGAGNFNITHHDGDSLWVEITFLPNPAFKFKISRSGEYENPFRIRETPGREYVLEEARDTKSIDFCTRILKEWVLRVKEEVFDSNPLNREIQLLRSDIETRIAALGKEQEDFFTNSEANVLKASLKEFAGRLDELVAQNKELKADIERLKEGVEDLSEATFQVNKATWYRMAGSKLLSATKSIFGSKEAREFVLEAAKKVLLEGPK
jgi:hypothetical protein